MTIRTFSLFAALALTGCAADGLDGTNGVDGMPGVNGVDGTDGEDAESIGVMNMSITGLVDLGPDFAYEGWVIVDGMPVTTGVFHVGADGYPSQTQFLVGQSDLDAASAYVLTIEPVPDMDPAPSATHILGGDIDAEGTAQVSVGHPAALGDDYLDASGSFILKTPTTGSDETDDTNGIWWLDPEGPSATLDLPDLSATGWRYEGWVVGPDGPISTGVFAAGDQADSDGAGPTAGPDALFSPPFPGQDFITEPIDLLGYEAVLTIEPYPDNSPAPFTALKPLADTNITNVVAPELQDMENTAHTFPEGTVTL